jgi:hypothetical protein
MSRFFTEMIPSRWLQRVRSSLRKYGYYYQADFCTETASAEPVITAGRILGHLYVPADTDPDQPVILTHPSSFAQEWHPFDRRASIGWHNDFSTRSVRPQLSLSWIRQEDPAGADGGAWRVASVSSVLNKLGRSREGRSLITDLSTQGEPFGYRDTGGWRSFRIVIRVGESTRKGLRFYGRALEEGASLRFGKIPDRTIEIIERIEEAADSVGEVLPAKTGSLLIVDNRLSLHDRLMQRVTGPEEQRRQAWLCFVRQVHKLL